MKKYIYTFLFSLICNVGFTQIQVTTITEPFNGSGGVTLDASGNLIVADFGDFLSAGDADGRPNNVWQFDPEGNRTIYAPGFIGASGNNFDNNGILYQSDIGASRIYKVINNQKVFVTATGISNPVGLVFDKDNNMYVCNCTGGTIRKITPTGASSQFASGTIFKCPNGITIDHEGNLYVSNFSDRYLIKITPAGVASRFAEINGNNNGHLRYFEPDSTLYVCSHGSSSIYTVDLQGNVTKLAGSGFRGNQDGTATQASFSRPNGIAISTTGDTLYVNSSIPLTNTPNFPLNPSVIRMITNVKGMTTPVHQADDSDFSEASMTFRLVQHQLIFSINTPQSGQFQLRIHDLSGRLHQQAEWIVQQAGKQEWQVDISALSLGPLVATLYYKGRVLKSFPFIKN